MNNRYILQQSKGKYTVHILHVLQTLCSGQVLLARLVYCVYCTYFWGTHVEQWSQNVHSAYNLQ